VRSEPEWYVDNLQVPSIDFPNVTMYFNRIMLVIHALDIVSSHRILEARLNRTENLQRTKRKHEAQRNPFLQTHL
jgi:hypothetical protein